MKKSTKIFLVIVILSLGTYYLTTCNNSPKESIPNKEIQDSIKAKDTLKPKIDTLDNLKAIPTTKQ